MAIHNKSQTTTFRKLLQSFRIKTPTSQLWIWPINEPFPLSLADLDILCLQSAHSDHHLILSDFGRWAPVQVNAVFSVKAGRHVCTIFPFWQIHFNSKVIRCIYMTYMTCFKHKPVPICEYVLIQSYPNQRIYRYAISFQKHAEGETGFCNQRLHLVAGGNTMQ